MDPIPTVKIPDTLPVMVLPCTLFPHTLLPLYIFEPRYRAMLAQALATDRMFCIGTCQPGDTEGEVAPISTAALVRACVTHENGTSHLLLLGVQRIHFVDWPQREPFRIANVESRKCEIEDTSLAMRLAEEAIELTRELAGPGLEMSGKVHEHLRSLDAPSAVADVIAHTFVTDLHRRQELLETLDV
ncbi:MAG: LON peptidase substrate-binding domain-containing protein, partial [Verrucomicrobiae bacterium]|nr:LON peptidase substrate-binding domain-containing protein [Verrucomicrobiae bacterium]